MSEPGAAADEPSPVLAAMQAEVAAEEQPDDGSIVTTLRTDYGEALIRVPAVNRWRSAARHALFTAKDDLAWATRTLSPPDAMAWMRLDPTQDEVDAFFDDWSRAVGVALGNALASRAPSRSTRGR